MNILVIFINYAIVIFLLIILTKDAKRYNIYLSKPVKILFFLSITVPFILLWYFIKRNKVIKKMKYYLKFDLKETGPFELSQLMDMVKNEQISFDYQVKTDVNPEWNPITSFTQLRPLFNLQKIRHGFTTFWIWLNLLGNGVFGIFGCYIFLVFPNRVLERFPHIGSYWKLIFVCMIVITGVTIIGFCELLNWKKIGYWIILGVQIFSTIGYFSNGLIDNAIWEITNSLLLFGILQLRKNGIDTWGQLS